MKTMARLAAAVAVACGAAAGAVATDAGTALSLMGSARQAALGGGAVAAARGQDGLGANPAGLAAADRPAIGGTWMRGDLGLSVGRLGAVLPGRLASVGVALGGLSAGNVDTVDAAGAPRTVDAQRDVTVSVGIARKLGAGVAAGVSAGWYRSTLAQTWNATARSVDAGLRWESPDSRVALGAAWLNAGERLRYAGKGAALPSQATVGAAWKLVTAPKAGMLLAADLAFRPDGRRTAGLGGELVLFGRLALRGGLRQEDAMVVRSAGLGLRMGGVRFDLAIAGSGETAPASRATLEVAL